jgi:hypothetical protein
MSIVCEFCNSTHRSQKEYELHCSRPKHICLSRKVTSKVGGEIIELKEENEKLKKQLEQVEAKHNDIIELMKANHKIELLELKNEMLEKMINMKLESPAPRPTPEPAPAPAPTLEQETKPASKVKEPNWTPEVSMEDVINTLSVNYEVMDDYITENDFGNETKDYKQYVKDKFKSKTEIEDFANHKSSPYQLNVMKSVYEQGAEEVIKNEVIRRMKNAKNIEVKDASRGKYFLYCYDKWVQKEEGDKQIMELANELYKEIIFQHKVFMECCSISEVEFNIMVKSQKVIFDVKPDSFINKVIKCLV